MLNLHFIASFMKYFYIILFAIFGFSIAKSEVKLELSKLSINFGDVPYCQKVTDTIIVKNSSTSTGNLKLLVGEKIIGVNSKNFRITNPKIKDLDLPPYDGTNSVIYVVEFDASIQPFGDKVATLIIPNDSKDSLIEIPITAKNIMVEYEVSPSEIDFQDISINQDYYADLDITIKSNRNGKIASVFWSEPTNLDVDASGTKDLISNTKRTFPVKIRLNKLGSFSGKIEVRISEPCDTTFVIPVKANAPNGFIQGFHNIDFGIVSSCEQKEENFDITFTGFGSGTINSVEIEGDGKENIELSFDKTIPVSFANNGATANCKVQYKGNSKNYGKKQIIVKFNAEINAEIKQYSIAIDYELAEVLLTSNSTSINFPDTYPNQVNSQSIELSNPSQFDIQIDKIELICTNSSEFSFKPTNTPITINKSDKKEFQVFFNPQSQNTNYVCKLEISYSSHGCNGTVDVDLFAKSLSKANLALSFANLNTLEIDPKANKLSIPLSISTLASEITINDTLIFEVALPRSVFFFDKIVSTNTTLTNNSIVNQNRFLTFRAIFNDTKITTQKSTFATLEGIPLLGDITSGVFAYKSFSFSSKSNSYEISQSLPLPFNLIVCSEGESRLLTFNDQNKSIIEIIYSDKSNIEIIFNAIESGNNKIILYDIMGNQIHNYELYTKGGNSYNINLKSNNLSSGTYFITIMSPSDIYSKKVIFNK